MPSSPSSPCKTFIQPIICPQHFPLRLSAIFVCFVSAAAGKYADARPAILFRRTYVPWPGIIFRMKIKIEKAFQFRMPTDAELAEGKPGADLPRFVDESDVHHLYWCDSGLFLILRQLFALLKDGRSIRGDRLPAFDDSLDQHINDPLMLLARFRHLFFCDIPRNDLSLSDVRVTRKGNWLVCGYRE